MAEQPLDKHRPIQSPLKTRRFKWREPENPIRWAFAKQLREQDKTKKVYPINPYAEVYRFRDNLFWDFLFDAQGQCIWTEFDRQDIIPYREYDIVGCPDGHRFNLGGDYAVELVFLPGHTPGHCAFLDPKNRILFAGDDACFGAVFIPGPEPGDPYGKYATVSAFRAELARLVARTDEFDGIFPGHGLVDMGTILLTSILEVCDRVLADPEHCDLKSEVTFGGHTSVRYNQMIYQSGYLSYNLSGV